MEILVYSAIMAALVLALVLIGHKLISRGRNPLYILILLVGLVVITMTVSYAAHEVKVRKELMAWH